MKTLRQKGYSLVEVVIVVAILSVIAVTGYRCVMYLTKEATQTSRAVTNPRRAQYDRFVGVLNDRLGQTWAFTAETASLQGINGNQLRLYDAGGMIISRRRPNGRNCWNLWRRANTRRITSASRNSSNRSTSFATDCAEGQ